LPAKRAKTVKRAPAKKKPAARKPLEPDFSTFPRGSVHPLHKWICLACVLDVFTRHIGLALNTARLEIKRYTPSLPEVKSTEAARPYFAEPSEGRCPYCQSPAKWHARLAIHRIEGGKSTDALRRAMVKSLPISGDQFVTLEEKATQQHAYFEWLEEVSTGLDLEDSRWLLEISQRYLSRQEPKTDWVPIFQQARFIRRSRRLENGWELSGDRLFLAPLLFDELLLVQYLITRSHKAGGLTLEGRYTLAELIQRLRYGGFLRAMEVSTSNPADALEKLLERLSGGEASLKIYYLIDRRNLLEKIAALKDAKPPRPKLAK
jgi:hypothetical protein